MYMKEIEFVRFNMFIGKNANALGNGFLNLF